MKITKDKILSLYSSLGSLGSLQGVRFAYGIAKNISVLEREVKAIGETIKATPEFSKFENERLELVKKYAKKDKDGKLMTIVDDRVEKYVMEDEAKFNKEFESLKKKHPKTLDERKKQGEEYNELLKTESEIELFKINLDDVPKDISVAQMGIIKDLIKIEE